MTTVGDVVDYGLLALCLGCLAWAGVLAIGQLGASVCKSEWEGSNLAYRYSLLGGCQVKVHDVWIPASNYRETE